MRAAILRLIVAMWLMLSPLNVTLDSPRQLGQAAVQPIEPRGSIELQPPRSLLSAGTPQTITLEIAPVTLIANSGATATITATVYDSNGDFVDGVDLTGSITPERGTLGTFPTTNLSGTTTSTWTATIGSSTVGTGTIQVFTDTAASTAFITLTADVPQTVTLTASPISLTVGATSVLTATVVDQYSNHVADNTLVVFTSSLGTPLSPRVTTSGIATSTIISTLAGTAHITATSDTVSGTTSVVFNPGAPFTITLQANTPSLVVGNTNTLTATVVDQFSNPVADNTSVVFTSSLGIPLSPRPTVNGIATSTISSTVAGTAYITATNGGRSGFASVTFNPSAPFSMTLQANPGSLTVDNSATLTATVVDQYNNFVTNGTNVTFTSSLGTAITPRLTSGGTATSTITSTLVGTAFISATSGTASGFTSVVFIPGAPFSMTLQASPASLTVGSTGSLTATVADQYSNLVTNGTNVTFTSSLGTALSPRPTSGGITTSTITSTVAGTAYITATSGTVSRTASIIFSPGAPFAITLQASPASLTVGNTGALTATVMDRYNNLVTNGTNVTFTSSLGTALSPRPTANGIATSTITSTVAGTAHITATYGTVSGTASVVFNPGAPYTLTLQPPTAVITAGQRITYTAIATDTYGNPIGNVTITTTFSITPTSGGVFAANVVTPTIKGTWIVTGVNGSAVGTTTLTVTAATFNRLSIENAPAGSGSVVNAVALDIYDTLTVYAAAYDAYNNLIGAQSVNWGGTGVVAGNISPTTGISTTFTPAISGTGTITAISGGITDTTGIVTVRAPLLRISKTASPNPVNPGDQLQYTIVYTNIGNSATQGALITETYPPSTTFFLAVPPPSGSNFWSIPPLGPGITGTIDLYLTVASQMPVSSVLTNTVRFGANRVNTAIYTTTTPVNSSPNLVAGITATSDPNPVRPGDTFAYIINYSNSGDAPVTGLRITETYPNYITYVSANPPPISGTNNVWITDTLAGGGTSRFIVVNVKVTTPVPDQAVLNNQIAIAANEAAPYTYTHQILVVAPNLQLTMAANPFTPTANSLLTYTLRYTNSGSSYAANTIVTDAIPANTSAVQCQPSGCSVNSGIATWNLGQLNAQISGSLTLTVQVANNLPNGTIITNTARITSTDLVAAVAVLTRTVASTLDVTLSKTDVITQIAAGQLTTYTLSFTNTGTAPAANVVITDRIPDNTIFVGCSSCVPTGGGVYSFTLSTLNATQSGAVTINVRMSPTLPAGLRVMTNTAAIRTTTPGDNTANNTAQDVNLISTVPTLALSPFYDSGTPYPGKVITYTLRYTNTSAIDTTGVVISVTRPSWLTSTPAGWFPNSTVDQRFIGNLAAGQSGSVTYVLTLPVSYTLDMSAFILPIMIQDDGPGGLPPAQAPSTTFIGVPDLSITQVVVPQSIVPGKAFTATVVISNGGTGRACNPNAVNCSGFYLDAFVDPATPPASYPFQGYGDPFTGVPPINAGSSITVLVPNIVFTTTQQPILYFKVDNYACPGTNCLPIGSQGGLVPEYNENNNVFGPISLSRFAVYLPLVRKSSP